MNIRKILEKKYNFLYKKDYDLPQDKCLYCNADFYCYDHRPALARLENISLKDYVKNGGEFKLIPSCEGCNKYLNSKDFSNIEDCLFHLLDKYNKKVNGMPIWTEEELEEMSLHMRSYIVNKQNDRNKLIDKITNIKKKIIEL